MSSEIVAEKSKMTELDKFKRRLVRSVSRLLKQDPVQQEIAWEQMRKETGCDCKLLWERMRALTIKKIKRLLAACDRTENIAAVARLSLTDWLLFDLVLVHEKLDVIGRDQLIDKNKTESPVLEDLFELVQKYNVESKSGEQLLEAWVALTRHYNSRGRQASPLLLQKRWYQLKENTRANFYKLWNSYRGNQKLWDVAKLYKPTPLQSEIAKKFPQVITQPFPEWNELVDMQKVILPDQFETQTRMKNRSKTADDKPDIVVIEPEIETIELGDDDTDDDPNKNKNHTQLEVNLALVKQEPVEDGLSNVQILETTHVQDNEDSNSHLSSIGEIKRLSLAQQMSNFLEDNSFEDTTTVVAVNEPEDVKPVVEEDQVVATLGDQDVETQNDQDVETLDDQDVETPGDQDVEIPDDLIKKKAEEFLKSRRKTVEEQKVEELPEETPKEDDDIMDDIIKQKADDFVRQVDIKKLVHDVVDEFQLPEEMGVAGGMHIADVGIELVDDGIEYEEEDEDSAAEKTEEEIPKPIIEVKVEEEKEEQTNEIKDDAPSPKFDLKLLMEPVVYTTKLDDMIIFKGKKFDFVELQNVIDSVIIESKPVSSKAINVETEDEVNDPSLTHSEIDDLFRKDHTSLPQPDNILSDDPFTKNQTNLPQPKKILSDDMFRKNETSLPHSNKMFSDDLIRKEILKDFNLDDTPASVLIDRETLNAVQLGREITKSVPSKTKKPVSVSTNVTKKIPKVELIDNDTMFNNENADSARQSSDDDNESDDPIDESLKVKTTSYLLQKPRNRSYNPIILCKNPDFNTRLKRLTAGFFSSERNRKLFSACKPMTIDLNKAFESKLINGTLYLKSTGEAQQPVREETDEVQSSSVMPSAMPIQSLLAKDKTKFNIQDLVTDTVDLTQRKKTINLKDLSEIRRINQNLLTAQVPPMRVESSGFVCNYPARMSVDSIETHVVEDDENDKVTGISGGQEVKPDSIETHVLEDDDKDEPKVTGISGGQEAQPASQENNEQPNDDTIPTTYKGKGKAWRGRGGPTRGTRGRGMPYRPQYLPSTFGESKVTVPWRLGPKPKKPSSLDDFLITIDTLNRMINKLDGTEEYKNPTKKNKKPNWAIQKDVRNSLDSNSNDAAAESEARPINTIDITAALNASQPVPDVMENVSVTTTPAPKKPEPKKRSRRKFCCWSREKLSRVEFGGTNTKPATWRKHACPVVCQCCCRDDLLQRMKLQNIVSEKSTLDAIELSDEEFYATDNDSSDVRIPGFDPVEEATPKPRLRVYSATTSTTPVHNQPAPIQPISSSCSHTNSTCTSVCTGRGVPLSVAGISTDAVPAVISTPTTSSLVPVPASTPAEPQPVLRINVNFTPAPVSEAPTQPVIPPITITETDVTPDTSLLQHIATKISSVSQNTFTPQTRDPQPSSIPPLVPLLSRPIIRKTRQRKITIPVQTTKPSVNQRQIVIDASKGPATTITADKMDDKIMILNSKTLSQKPKESPIFLGKDTILLTTVKFPLNFRNLAPAAPPIQAPKVIPALPLPSGVQLVLMPDGQLSYTVDPSVELDAAQLAAMPSILAAVQQQISMVNQPTGATEINTAIGSITPSSSVAVGDNIVQPTLIDLEKQGPNAEQANSDHVTKTAEILTEAKSSTKDPNSSKDSDIITIEENDEPTNASTSNTSTSENKAVETNEGTDDNVVNDNASGSRNLLSDLMEMSGIFAEDTKHIESPTKQAATVGENTLTTVIQATPAVDNIVTPIAAGGNIVNPAIQVMSAGENIENTAMKVVSTSGPVETSNTINLPELSPITSLIELKYACENNGLFYKLDLNTGVIAPINVCIKKNFKPNTKLVRGLSLVPKGVIDLTDEADIPKNIIPKITRDEDEVLKNITKEGAVKPIKLFKRVVVQPPNLLKRKHVAQHIVMNAKTKQIEIKKHTRKQSVQKIEAKIDLVDSDAPMEEEYLVDSSGSDDEMPRPTHSNRSLLRKQLIATRVMESDDSSDEEPLAKKFTRLKQMNESSTQEKNANPDAQDTINNPKDRAIGDTTEVQIDPNAPKDLRVPTESPKSSEMEVATELPVPIGPPKPAALEAAELDDNLNPDEMEFEEEYMAFMAEGNEPQDEDCILGV